MSTRNFSASAPSTFSTSTSTSRRLFTSSRRAPATTSTTLPPPQSRTFSSTSAMSAISSLSNGTNTSAETLRLDQTPFPDLAPSSSQNHFQNSQNNQEPPSASQSTQKRYVTRQSSRSASKSQESSHMPPELKVPKLAGFGADAGKEEESEENNIVARDKDGEVLFVAKGGVEGDEDEDSDEEDSDGELEGDEEREAERRRLAEVVRRRRCDGERAPSEPADKELMDDLKASLRAKVAALTDDNWMYEPELEEDMVR